MSSTNKTSNYELSQFLGTDKPAWLSDYNTDMSKIDTQMKANADAATAASGSATTANTAIGTLDNLTTTAKTDLVSAINEVDADVATAQNTANSANGTAVSASQGVTDITAYLNLNTFNTFEANDMTLSGSGSIRSASVTVARNTAGTLCKVYGSVVLDTTSGASFTLTIPNTGLNTSENITVSNAGFVTLERNAAEGGGVRNVDVLSYKINTDGSVSVTMTAGASVTVLRFLACLIFVKNFGD